jgi:hypothetical protein
VGVVGRWPLAIGPSVLSLARILHNSRNSINAHTQRIFVRSKIFRLEDTGFGGEREEIIGGNQNVLIAN